MTRNKNDIQIKLLADCQVHIPKLAVLWYEEISKHWVPAASVERAKQNLINHSNRTEMPLTFVAIQNDEPIGMASLRENDGIRPDLKPWLGSLTVHPNYRGCGIGEMLIEHTKKQAKNFNFKELYLLAFDLSIPNWYAKLGWENIGIDTLFNHPVTVMSINFKNNDKHG